MGLFLPWLGVGLVTSVHCVSMCGMLVLSYAVKGVSGGPFAQRLVPHLAYHIAKIFSYTAVGLALGAIGAVFDVGGIRGWIMVAAGVFMVLLGFNMTGRAPWLKRLVLKPPAFLVGALFAARRAADRRVAEKGHTGVATPLIFGLLTGLMPCGPLQAAQLAAAGTGSSVQGAVVMLGFGLGTAPLMLAFGTASGFLTARFKDRMMVASALVIVILGLVMANRGAVLLGSPVTAQTVQRFLSGATTQGGETSLSGSEEVVDIPLTIADVRYQPSTISIPADQRVRLIVDRREDNVCSDELLIPQLGVSQRLAPFGTTVVEIPPARAGTYSMTCQMGMMSGVVVVGSAQGSRVPLALIITTLVILGALFVLSRLRRTQLATCEANGGVRSATSASVQDRGTTMLGLTPQEVLIIVAFMCAAIIAGLTLGNALGR